MDRKYPYPRWLQLKLTPLEQIRYGVLSPFWRLRARLDRLWRSEPVWRRIGGPLQDRKYAPFVAFSPEAGTPVVLDPTLFACRTRHGAATLYWDGFGRYASGPPRPARARNALLPDGTRGDVHGRAADRWRRTGSGGKVWILGTVEIRPDDIVFVDRASQDLEYTPPTAPMFRLERDVALHRPFVAALADDKFAAVAHSMLTNLEWVPIGAREIGLFDSPHRMIACLRNKGEDYLDFKFGGYPKVKLTEPEVEEHRRRLKEFMRSLGWRTYTADELRVKMQEHFRARVERRVGAWRRLDAYEARPAGSHDVLERKALVIDMPLYEGDDEGWLDELRDEERRAVSSHYVLRLKALAASGRLTAEEYEDLAEYLL